MTEMFDKNKKAKKYLTSLVQLSKIGGKLDKKEKDFLYVIGKKQGLEAKEIDKIIEKVKTTQLQIPYINLFYFPVLIEGSNLNHLHIPENKDEKINLLIDCLVLLNVDEQVSEEELDYVTNFALRLGFKSEIAGIMVRKMAMELKYGKSREQIKDKIIPFLVY